MPLVEDLALFLREIRGGRAVRGYFVTTLFDAIFVNLGIIVGTAFTIPATTGAILKTMFTADLFIGISTGVSVFEAETVESEIRLARISRAMLRSLEDTEVERSARVSRAAISVANFLAPLMVFGASSMPFLGIGDVRTAAYTAVALALTLIFVIGALLGRQTGRNPLLKGARLAGIGLLAYLGVTYLDRLLTAVS